MLGRVLRQLWASKATRRVPAAGPTSPALLQQDAQLLRQGLTIIVPSVHSRVEHVRATLGHFASLALPTTILISDHSPAALRGPIEEAVSQFDPLSIRLIHHDPALHFLERLADCASQAATPYVVVHADDDRLMAPALARGVEFLNRHEDHVACLGRIFFVQVSKSGPPKGSIQGVKSRAEDTLASRLLAQCNAFTPTLYAVTRRDAFVHAATAALAFTTNVIFWQYLSAVMLLSLGKLHALDELYYFRLDNPRGWRSSLIRGRDRSHWPYLVTSKDFSSELEKFKNGLRSVLGRGAEDGEAMEDLVDDCCVGLIRRAFGAPQTADPSEMELLQRLETFGTTERLLMEAFANDAKDALDRMRAAS